MAEVARRLNLASPVSLYRITSSQEASRRNIGDRLARALEYHFGKAPGWMDRIGGDEPLPADIPRELIEDYRALLPDDQRRVLSTLSVRARRARAYRAAGRLPGSAKPEKAGADD